jgi:AcrR family transcriptional regulator
MSSEKQPRVDDTGDGVPGITKVRSSLRSSRDPRAVRTRAALIAATATVMHRSPESFSAESIAQEAGVSRSSFYAHFTSAEAALFEVFRETLEKGGRDGASIMRPSSSHGLDFARAATAAVVKHVAENQALYRAVLRMDLPAEAYTAVFADFAATTEAAILSLETVPTHVTPSTAATYIAGGALAVLRTRILLPDPLDENLLVEELVGMIPDWFAGARFTATALRVLHPADTH